VKVSTSLALVSQPASASTGVPQVFPDQKLRISEQPLHAGSLSLGHLRSICNGPTTPNITPALMLAPDSALDSLGY
jgi:hypothetical protein